MAAPSPGPAQFAEWVYETYRDQLGLSEAEGSQKFKKFLAGMAFDSFPLSGAVRVQSFHIVKFGYPLRRAGYTAAVFSARVLAAGERAEAFFAYAYWPRDAGAEAPPEYLCLSPTFESRDGEYRHRFLWYPQFAEGYESLVTLLSPLEEILLEALQEDQLGIDVALFPAEGRGATDALAFVEKERLGVRALAAALATDALRARDGMFQNHASAPYTAVMKILYEKCAAVLAGWGPREIDRVDVFATGKENQPLRTQCGQKLTPLTVRESLQVNDINFAPWREIWVGRAATDLVVNGAAPMFPIYNNWTFLDGVDRFFFENAPMRQRYERGARAEKAAAALRKARAALDEGQDFRLGQLDAHVYDSLLYAQDFLLLTELALCSTSEYVGDTFPSVAEVARRSEWVSPAYLLMFSDPARVARYLFDLCYGAHLLHARVGAVHADLHLNNITVYPLEEQHARAAGAETASFEPRYRDPVIAYIAGAKGEAETYVFPHDGWFACLIDYSRAILGPEARPRIAAESGDAFAAAFYRNQVGRALRVLHHYLPEYVEANQEKIKALLLADFGRLFRVMTAVDFLAIGRNVGAFLRGLAGAPLREGDRRRLEVAPEGIATARAVEERALEHLVVHLSDLVEPGGGGEPIPFAGDQLLPAVFGAYLYAGRAAALQKATLVDAYNAAVPLRYSGSDYAKFPPWARLDQLEEHLAGLKVAQVTADRGERPFLRALDLDGYLAVLQERVREGIADRPAAKTSSWIAD